MMENIDPITLKRYTNRMRIKETITDVLCWHPPRFFNPSRNYIVTTSLKVMYTTLCNQKSLVIEHKTLPKSLCIRLVLRKFLLTATKHIVLVRNPYDRIVSFFEDKTKQHPIKYLQPGFKWQGCQKSLFPYFNISFYESDEKICRTLNEVSFEQFISILPEIYKNDSHLWPQISILFMKIGPVALRLRVDEIIRLEEIEKLRQWGVDVRIVENKTEHRSFSEYYTEKTYGVVNKLYRNDFTIFGYKKLK